MDALARTCLERLLLSGEKLAAGRRSRAASLTKSDLDEYRRLTSLQRKELFESTVKAAWIYRKNQSLGCKAPRHVSRADTYAGQGH